MGGLAHQVQTTLAAAMGTGLSDRVRAGSGGGGGVQRVHNTGVMEVGGSDRGCMRGLTGVVEVGGVVSSRDTVVSMQSLCTAVYNVSSYIHTHQL